MLIKQLFVAKNVLMNISTLYRVGSDKKIENPKGE